MAQALIQWEIREIKRECKKKTNKISRLRFKNKLSNQMTVMAYYKHVLDRFQDEVLVKCADTSINTSTQFRTAFEKLLSEPPSEVYDISKALVTEIVGLDLSLECAVDKICGIFEKHAKLLDLYERIIVSCCEDQAYSPNIDIPSAEDIDKKMIKILKSHALSVRVSVGLLP